MKNNTTLFRFVLIAFFLFAYQTTTIHSKHDHLSEFSECQVCIAFKSLGTSQHETVFSLQSESIAIEVSEVEEKRIVKDAYDLTQTPEQKTVCFDGMLALDVSVPPFGFDANAPPYILS
ncbi:hypothetical protein PGH07_10725 [Sulfurovum sp. zt1-1]|uniref:Uncharacterized protein n=1 Tax=Sulfurovum zhangzhouensis TaxID=3019067 RepID=A0ABT7R0M4_9BACT|nr:hypothetical protein [Sulfurovum zhangzhouensis]MDM5272645.1 hypothetical protein [Sulfurovum zhangzhouensis]